MRIKILLACLVLLSSIVGCKKNEVDSTGSSDNSSFSSVTKTTAPTGLNVGNAAPEFTTHDFKGNPVSLASLRGNYVLLEFWGTWCGLCPGAAEGLKPVYEKFKNKKDPNGFGFILLGIAFSESNLDAAKKFALTEPWPNLVNDEKVSISGLYKIGGAPLTYLIGPHGEVVDAGQLLGQGLDNKLTSLGFK